MSVSSCCVKGFQWDGTPEEKVVPFSTSSNQAYVTGASTDAAVLLIHDLFGWEYPNIRLLADHFAREVAATVYVPDFFGGETLPAGPIKDMRFDQIDLPGFMKKNARNIREPEIFECARKLRSEYGKVGAVGYCYGGWAVFRLGAEGNGLVDCIVAGHPSLLTKEDIDRVGVPVQVLAPEIDPAYSAELKEHTWKVIPTKGVPFDYQFFPGVEHACLVRGSPKVNREREAMARGKNAAVSWLRQFLKNES